MRSASHAGTRPPCNGRSAVPEGFMIPIVVGPVGRTPAHRQDHSTGETVLGLLRRWRSSLRPWRSLLLAFHLLRRSKNRVQSIPFHSRTEFDHGAISNFLQQAFEYLTSQIGMRHLAAAKENGGFYLVALLEEAQYVVLLELVIVLV